VPIYEGWPEHLRVGAVRFAWRTNHFDETVAFYRDLVGLPLLLTFDAHEPDNFAGAVFGMPDASATFELISSDEPVPVDRHEELVLYLGGPDARDEAVRRLTDAGLAPCEQYHYWTANESVTFLDPDGREVVFAPWVFGAELPPAVRRRQAQQGS
jgi:catechol 2,3-dioxygenase-like lactoylglutathione lyase family enzyme